MVRKAVKKTTKTVRKSARKIAKKTIQSGKQSKKPSRVGKDRTVHCITVCGKDKCVLACATENGAISGSCIPCPICNHGHFCENDFTCLSCGATRGMTVRPYKGE